MVDNSNDSDKTRDFRNLMRILWIGFLLAVIGIGLAQGTGLLAAVAIGLLILLTSFVGGCFFGFLFGLPRVNAREAEAISAPGAAAAPMLSGAAGGSEAAPAATPAARTRSRVLQSNTNLERISDWLTTMLVGATLVELHRINDGLITFRDFLDAHARVFVGTDGATHAGALPVVGPVVLVFGAFAGFLYMYLNTRLVLVRLFYAIEKLLSSDEELEPTQQRAVIAIAGAGEGNASFVRQNLGGSRGATVDDALGLMFDLLYKSDPDRVIQIGATLASSAQNRPDYWFYLAAAFGQQLHRLERGTDEWISARDNALDCARRAVALAPAYRERLWAISDPKGPDNDLAPLREDREFLRIVGRGSD